ncbi:MAG: hypothetical protein ACLQOO_16635 [Terriglobia bacterium]
MDDTLKLLQRQAAWQKSRVALTWAEKVRMAEAVRESVAQLRRARSPKASGVPASKDPPGSPDRQRQQA